MGIISITILTATGLYVTIRIKDSYEKSIHRFNMTNCDANQNVCSEAFLRRYIPIVRGEDITDMYDMYIKEKSCIKRFAYYSHLAKSSPQTLKILNFAKEGTLDGRALADAVINYMLNCHERGFCDYLFRNVQRLINANNPNITANVTINEAYEMQNQMNLRS